MISTAGDDNKPNDIQHIINSNSTSDKEPKKQGLKQ